MEDLRLRGATKNKDHRTKNGVVITKLRKENDHQLEEKRRQDFIKEQQGELRN